MYENSSIFNMCKMVSKKKQSQCICPVCDEAIIDGKKGQESIHCEGLCQSWFHRKCAGLSRAAFKAVSAPSYSPYLCPNCRLDALVKEIVSLKVTISSLSQELSDLKSSRSVSTSPDESNSGAQTSQQVSGSPKTPTNTVLNQRKDVPHQNHDYDKKFKIVFYGIKESPRGTPLPQRRNNDHDSIYSAIASVEPTFAPQSIRDCGRLGRYKESQCPRPVVVHLSRATDVATILSKRSSLRKPIVVKPYMSPDERACEAILLQQRWSLIQSRSRIKIRKSRLFKDEALQGEVINRKYHPSIITSSDPSDPDDSGNDSTDLDTYTARVSTPDGD